MAEPSAKHLCKHKSQFLFTSPMLSMILHHYPTYKFRGTKVVHNPTHESCINITAIILVFFLVLTNIMVHSQTWGAEIAEIVHILHSIHWTQAWSLAKWSWRNWAKGFNSMRTISVRCLIFKFKINVVVNDLFMKRVIKIRRYVSMVLSIILLTHR